MSTKIIAEIGWNFLGDLNLAKRMIQEAKKSGADYAKFQTWKVKNLKPGPWDSDGRREIYEKAELSEAAHFELKNFCDFVGIKFLTSCFNKKDLKFIRSLSDEVKIPSTECLNKELIEEAIRLEFDRIIISTGATTRDEKLDLILGFCDGEECESDIVFMHCVSSYPCEAEDVNMSAIEIYKRFLPDKNIGYSGHYCGIEDAQIAIVKNVGFVEKHFTLDNTLPGRDNKFAILPKEMSKLSEFRDLYNKMSGSNLDLNEKEKDMRENYTGRWDS